MKIKNPAVAALAALGACTALAQSSVRLYGIVDLSIRRTSGLNDFAPASGSWTGLSSGVDNTSRWGVRVNEDLGGGLSAQVNLESGLSADTGAPANATTFFDRQSWVGLGSPWGVVTLGRQTTLLADAVSPIDPLGLRLASFNPAINVAGLSQHQLGIAYGPSGSTGGAYRLNNSIKYSGEFGGFTVRLMRGIGEEVNNTGALSSNGIGAGYRNGGLVISAAHQTFRNNTDRLGLRGSVLGAAYTFAGGVRVAGIYGLSRAETSATARTDLRTAGLGATVPVGKLVDVTLAHYRVDRHRTGRVSDGYSRTVAFGEYKLSRRTVAYVEADYTQWRDGFQGTGNKPTASGYGAGLRHTF